MDGEPLRPYCHEIDSVFIKFEKLNLTPSCQVIRCLEYPSVITPVKVLNNAFFGTYYKVFILRKSRFFFI